MTKSQAVRLIGGLLAAYRTGQTISDDTADAYVEDVLDLDFEPAALAIKTLRQTSRFLPSIAEIRQAAAEIHSGHLPDEDEAWAEVMANIRAHGWTGHPTWTHPAIETTVRTFGWRDLCASTNQVADRAHFLALYRTQRVRLERDRQIDPAIREMAALVAQMPKELGA